MFHSISNPNQAGQTERLVRLRLSGRRLKFRFTGSLLHSLGWRIGDRIAVGLGVGADFGRVRLSPAFGEEGYTLSRYGQGAGAGVVETTVPASFGLFLDLAQAAPDPLPYQASGFTLTLFLDGRPRIRVPAVTIREVA